MAPWQQQVQAKVAGRFFSSPGVTFCTNCIFQVSISVENRSNGRVRYTLMQHRCCGIEPSVMIARYRRPPICNGGGGHNCQIRIPHLTSLCPEALHKYQ